MKTIEEEALDYAEETKDTTNGMFYSDCKDAFKAGIEFAQRWIPVEKTLPSVKNGFIDEDVLVCVKNKNKEDGILLFDISSFDGETWSKRHHTWEKIIGWRAIELK